MRVKMPEAEGDRESERKTEREIHPWYVANQSLLAILLLQSFCCCDTSYF